MKKTIIMIVASYIGISLANMSPEGFERFSNYYFVGTGSCTRSLNLALKARFSETHFLIPDVPSLRYARDVSRTFNNVFTWYADSSILLGYIISKMDKPITFWLDNGKAPRAGAKNNPILQELDFIAQHPIKTHTILIDDMHVVGTAYFDFLTKDDLIQKIKKINPKYKITYVAGGDQSEYPTNVMVATII